VISKPSVAIVVETHSKLDIPAIKVDNHMVVIQVQVEKDIVGDVYLDVKTSVNIITKNLITKLGLPKPRPIPYHLKMANQNMTRPLGIIKKIEDSHTWYTIYSYI
jgi:hypothetical protein